MGERRRSVIVAAVLLAVASIGLFWPGYVLYDSAAQYRTGGDGCL